MLIESPGFFELFEIPQFKMMIMRPGGEGGLTGMHCNGFNGVGMSLVYVFKGFNLVDHQILVERINMMFFLH